MNRFITVACVAALSVSLAGCWTNGTGEKIGIITKLAKQGALCPTWEAEIVRGGFNAGTGVNGKSFDFSIESDELATRLKNALEASKEVKIHYHSEMSSFCRSESDNHFLDSFEVVGDANASQLDITNSVPNQLANVQVDKKEMLNRLMNQNQQILDLLKNEK